MLEQSEQFDTVMAAYLAEPLLAAERRALGTIAATIDEYRARLTVADTGARENWPVEQVDRLVRIDDGPAIQALRDLEAIWQQSRGEGSGRIGAAVTRGMELVRVGYAAMALVVLAALAVAVLIGLLVIDLRRKAVEARSELAARKRLERSEYRLVQAVEQSPATVVITDTRARIRYVNRRFEEVSGWARDEVLGRTPRFLQSGDTPTAEYAAMRAALGRGETWKGVLRNRRKDGGSYLVDIAILPLLAPDGTVHSFAGIGEDITERRKAQDQVVRTQKIEAVGLMASGIAHDFNNVLASILGAAHLAALDAPPGSRLAEEIEQIDIGARRARSLVGQLLGFARSEPGRPVATDIGDVAAEVVRLIRAAAPSSVRIRGLGDCAETFVLADPTHLHQILMNLCTNAVEAIGGGDATITLGFRRCDEVPPGLAARTEGWIEARVEDTGAGMSADTRAHMFDAFYSTKPLGRGTGLGLSVVQGLVQDMGGCILVDSEPGRGCCVRVFLPGADPDREAQGPVDAARPRTHESILVVDDRMEVVAALRRGLIRQGFRVEAFTLPAAALEHFTRDPDRYRLVVTDVAMPGLDGVEMATRMRALRPGLPVILYTGQNAGVIPPEGGPMLVLSKPVDPSEMGRHIREMLDTGAAAAS